MFTKIFTSIKINNLNVTFLDFNNDLITQNDIEEWFISFCQKKNLDPSHPLHDVDIQKTILDFDHIMINGIIYNPKEYKKHYMNGNISITSIIYLN